MNKKLKPGKKLVSKKKGKATPKPKKSATKKKTKNWY